MRAWSRAVGLGVLCALTFAADAAATPTAAFTVTPSGPQLTQTDLTFDATTSHPPTNAFAITNYSWHFGDGSPDVSGPPNTAQTVHHQFATAGGSPYTVTLTVTDNEPMAFQTAQTMQTVTVTDRPPVAAFPTPTSAKPGTAISFDGSSSSDLDGTINASTGYSWDWGDGSHTNNTVANPTHTYAAGGNHTVTLTVIDNSGNTNSVAHTIVDRSPVASFTAGPPGVLTQQQVSFDASASTDPDGTVNAYSWDFGDGTPAGTGPKPTHVYAHSGQYNVTLTVIDDAGLSGTATLAVTITDRPPVASFTTNATSVAAGDYATFDGSSSFDVDGTIVGQVWLFGDGTTAVGTTAEHNYAAPGTYTVTHGVVDDSGTFGLSTRTITVTDSGLGFSAIAPEFFPPRLSLSGVRVSRSGAVTFTVGCPASTGGCTGSVTLFTDPSSRSRSLRVEQRLGAVALNLPPGGSAALTLKIPSRVRSLLARAHGSVHLYAVSADASGEFSLADAAVRVH